MSPTGGYQQRPCIAAPDAFGQGSGIRAIVVMACDDEILPLQGCIESIADDADMEEVYNTKRQLHYLASTRARDYLLVTSTEPASEFVDDLRE